MLRVVVGIVVSAGRGVSGVAHRGAACHRRLWCHGSAAYRVGVRDSGGKAVFRTLHAVPDRRAAP